MISHLGKQKEREKNEGITIGKISRGGNPNTILRQKPIVIKAITIKPEFQLTLQRNQNIKYRAVFSKIPLDSDLISSTNRTADPHINQRSISFSIENNTFMVKTLSNSIKLFCLVLSKLHCHH
jgi:hypothetical protein